MNGREQLCFVVANYLGLQPTTVALSGFGMSVPRACFGHLTRTIARQQIRSNTKWRSWLERRSESVATT
jgi:hypothetical protein